MTDQILTPKDRPDHYAIGRFFYGFDDQVYFCDSYEPRYDFWMTNVVDSRLRKAISSTAIGRTWHPARDEGKPQIFADVVGQDYYAVDTRVAPEILSQEKLSDAKCIGLDDRIALFSFEGDARKFIERIRRAQGLLASR